MRCSPAGWRSSRGAITAPSCPRAAPTAAAGGGAEAGDRGTPGRVPLLADPGRAYAALLGLTLMNPATIVYFTALVVGDRATGGRRGAAGAVFVAAVFAASASWQLAWPGAGPRWGAASPARGPAGHRPGVGGGDAALAAHLALAG